MYVKNAETRIDPRNHIVGLIIDKPVNITAKINKLASPKNINSIKNSILNQGRKSQPKYLANKIS